MLCCVANKFEGQKANGKKITFYNQTNQETIHLCPDEWICVGISNCLSHKDKACLSVLETRFISSRCMKLKLTQRLFSKLKRFQCSIKLEQRFYSVFKPRTRYQNALFFRQRKIFPFHSITFALLQLFMYQLLQMFCLVK